VGVAHNALSEIYKYVKVPNTAQMKNGDDIVFGALTNIISLEPTNSALIHSQFQEQLFNYNQCISHESYYIMAMLQNDIVSWYHDLQNVSACVRQVMDIKNLSSVASKGRNDHPYEQSRDDLAGGKLHSGLHTPTVIF
jgi:hypothetical protein